MVGAHSTPRRGACPVALRPVPELQMLEKEERSQVQWLVLSSIQSAVDTELEMLVSKEETERVQLLFQEDEEVATYLHNHRMQVL